MAAGHDVTPLDVPYADVMATRAPSCCIRTAISKQRTIRARMAARRVCDAVLK